MLLLCIVVPPDFPSLATVDVGVISFAYRDGFNPLSLYAQFGFRLLLCTAGNECFVRRRYRETR